MKFLSLFLQENIGYVDVMKLAKQPMVNCKYLTDAFFSASIKRSDPESNETAFCIFYKMDSGSYMPLYLRAVVDISLFKENEHNVKFSVNGSHFSRLSLF